MPSFEKPKNLKRTIFRLFYYLKRYYVALIVVLILMLINTAAMLAGSYFLKPLINNYILPGDFPGLAKALIALGSIYLVGILAIFGQNR